MTGKPEQKPADAFGLFASRDDRLTVETGDRFSPKFDDNGLIPAIVTQHGGHEVLMFAFMNAEALRLSIETGVAHFYSRSRAKLWKKGEESGNILRIQTMYTDCDQDVVWLGVSIEGDGVACHTGERSCFYRQVSLGPTSKSSVRLTRA